MKRVFRSNLYRNGSPAPISFRIEVDCPDDQIVAPRDLLALLGLRLTQERDNMWPVTEERQGVKDVTP